MPTSVSNSETFDPNIEKPFPTPALEMQHFQMPSTAKYASENLESLTETAPGLKPGPTCQDLPTLFYYILFSCKLAREPTAISLSRCIRDFMR